MKKPTSRVSRRRFVRTAAAAVAAPAIVPRSVFGQGDNSAPNDRIGVGIIGPGKMGSGWHVSTLLGFSDVQILAMCDVDTTRREFNKKRVDDKYGNSDCTPYNHFRDVLARKDVQAVLIATPDHWHAIPIIEACQAGKDVYCEKPLTLTILEAKRCIDAVRKYKRVFQTGSQQRSNNFGKFREACEIVRSGRLGKIKSLTVGVGGPSRPCDLPEEPMEPGLDWDLWLGQAPMRPYNSVLSPRGVHNHFPAWRAYREYSGGGMTDMGAHHYDIAQWCLGMDDSGPVEIIPPEDLNAQSGVKYIYEGGIEMTHGGPQGCVFTGEKGTLHIGRGVLTSDPESIVKDPLADDEVHLPHSPGHHRDWLNCIRIRGRCIADVEIGARSVTVCHLGNLAYWYDRPLRWDPKSWQFVGPAEDKALIDRERRDPWQLPEA